MFVQERQFFDASVNKVKLQLLRLEVRYITPSGLWYK